MQEDEGEALRRRLEESLDLHPDDPSLHFDLVIHPTTSNLVFLLIIIFTSRNKY